MGLFTNQVIQLGGGARGIFEKMIEDDRGGKMTEDNDRTFSGREIRYSLIKKNFD